MAKVHPVLKATAEKHGIEIKMHSYSSLVYHGTLCQWQAPVIHAYNNSSLAHELAHWFVSSPQRRKLENFGLGDDTVTSSNPKQTLTSRDSQREEELASMLGIMIEQVLGMQYNNTAMDHNWVDGFADHWKDINSISNHKNKVFKWGDVSHKAITKLLRKRLIQPDEKNDCYIPTCLVMNNKSMVSKSQKKVKQQNNIAKIKLPTLIFRGLYEELETSKWDINELIEGPKVKVIDLGVDINSGSYVGLVYRGKKPKREEILKLLVEHGAEIGGYNIE